MTGMTVTDWTTDPCPAGVTDTRHFNPDGSCKCEVRRYTVTIKGFGIESVNHVEARSVPAAHAIGMQQAGITVKVRGPREAATA